MIRLTEQQDGNFELELSDITINLNESELTDLYTLLDSIYGE